MSMRFNVACSASRDPRAAASGRKSMPSRGALDRLRLRLLEFFPESFEFCHHFTLGNVDLTAPASAT